MWLPWRENGDEGSVGVWVAAGVCLATTGVGLLALVARKKKAEAKRRRREPATQAPRARELVAREREDAFHGLRVVDMGTHVAAPTGARVLGDLGAEVVKVEVPTGDMLRDVLTVFEKPRTHGTMFENQNLSKFSVTYDLKTADGQEQLHALLDSADVLITNTRIDSLKQLGLDYASIKDRYPRLVYAFVSAWGRDGEEYASPGFDLGAFWTATGMCTLVSEEAEYSRYPGAFGDQSTGQLLLGGVAAALTQRLKTGKGGLVETSLLHCGSWVMAAPILASAAVADGVVPPYTATPPRKVVDEIYQLKDGGHVAVEYHGSFAEEASAEKALLTALGLTVPARYEDVAARIASLTIEELREALAGTQVCVHQYSSIHTRAAELKEMVAAPGYDAANGVVDPTPPGFDDVPFIPRVPQEFLRAGHAHGPTKAAPHKGEHSDCVSGTPWLNEPIAWPAASGPTAASAPLKGVKVLVAWDIRGKHDIAVAATGQLLRGAGCEVVLAPNGDLEKDGVYSQSKALHAHLVRGVTVMPASDVASAIDFGFDVVLTDASPAEFKASYGVDVTSLENMAVVRLTAAPGEAGEATGQFGALSAMWLRGGLANIMGGEPASDIRRFFEHGLEAVASCFLYSAVSMALFHAKQRGRGEEVAVSYERIGSWLSQLQTTFIIRDPKQTGLVLTDKQAGKLWERTPLFVFNSHRTRDGMWVQLLGLDNGVHLPRLLKAFGIKGSVYAAAAYQGLFKSLPNFKERNLLNRCEPIFVAINQIIRAGFEARTYAEIKALFATHEVWYTPIRTPGQLLDWAQIKANRIITEDAGEVVIGVPVVYH